MLRHTSISFANGFLLVNIFQNKAFIHSFLFRKDRTYVNTLKSLKMTKGAGGEEELTH